MKRRALVAVGLAALAAALAFLVPPWLRGPTSDETADSAADRQDSAGDGLAPLPALHGRPSDRAPTDAAAGRGADAGGGVSGARGSRISGQVVDAFGKPVRGAVVRTVDLFPEVRATADFDGRFVVELPVSGVLLRVSAPGLPDRIVSAAGLAPDARISLPKGWTISGTIRDAATDAPIVSVPVYARPATSPDSPTDGVANWQEDGTFVVAVPDSGTYVLDVGERYVEGARAPADDWIPTRVDGVAAGTADVRIALARGLSIEGKIVDEAGDPVVRTVSVDAVGRTPSGDPDYTTRKVARIAAGDLRVPGLKAGRYDLWIRPDASPGDENGAGVSATVVRDVEAGTRGLLVRLSRGLMLVGRLEDGHGGLVVGPGYVYAYREGEIARSHAVVGRVGGDGTFRVGPLDEGFRYDLLATGFPGRRQGTTTRVSPRDAGVVVVLEGAGRISGRVETADGKPVPAGVPVGVIGEGSDPRASGMRLFGYTAVDGTFAVDGLADFTFSVEAGGGRSGYLGVLVAGVKPGTADLVLKVSVGVDLSGTLVDENGAPLATTSLNADDGARVAAMRPFAQVGSDGKFLLRGLRAGRVRLSVRRGEAYVAAGEVEAPGTDLRVAVPAR